MDDKLSGDSESDDAEDIAAGEEFLFGFQLEAIKSLTIAEDTNSPNDNGESMIGYGTIVEDSTSPPSYHVLVKSLCEFQYQRHDQKRDDTTENDFQKLFEWATLEGATLDGMVCGTDAHGGRGLFATKELLPTEVIAVLPRSLRWGQSYACRYLGLPASTPDLTALTLLVLALCRQDHVYAKSLPRQDQFTNALFFPASEEEWWRSTDEEYGSAIRRVKSIAEGCQNYIRHVLLKEEKYNNSLYEGAEDRTSHCDTEFTSTLLWAISMVKSRSHAFGSKRGYWLTPVLDMLNHSPTPNAVLVGGDEGQLLLQAQSTISKGSEITIDYQVDDDPMLLATYGFSLQHTYPRTS